MKSMDEGDAVTSMDSTIPELFDPRYTQSAFNVFFSKTTGVQRFASAFNEVLKAAYFPAQELSIPDDADAEIPRLLFASQHGFSQLIVSQSSISLIVQYSPDWQVDISQGLNYLLERVELIFDMVDQAGITALFSGLSTTARIQAKEEGEMLLALASRHAGCLPSESPHEVNAKISTIVDSKFFRNISIRNYRTWSVGPFQQGIVRLSEKNANERGVEISIDFNDRFAFNNSQDYVSGREIALHLVQSGISDIQSVVKALEGGTW